MPQLPQDSDAGALPNAPGVLGSSAELVRTQKCQQAGNDHEGRWKAEGEQKQMNEAKQARFVIVNTCDAPCRRHVCEWKEGVGYCYMWRDSEPHLKDYDGMRPSSPTPIEAFGFRVTVNKTEAIFEKIGPGTAIYEDGVPRRWQDGTWDTKFSLPLVGKISRKGKEIGK